MFYTYDYSLLICVYSGDIFAKDATFIGSIVTYDINPVLLHKKSGEFILYTGNDQKQVFLSTTVRPSEFINLVRIPLLDPDEVTQWFSTIHFSNMEILTSLRSINFINFGSKSYLIIQTRQKYHFKIDVKSMIIATHDMMEMLPETISEFGHRCIINLSMADPLLAIVRCLTPQNTSILFRMVRLLDNGAIFGANEYYELGNAAYSYGKI